MDELPPHPVVLAATVTVHQTPMRIARGLEGIANSRVSPAQYRVQFSYWIRLNCDTIRNKAGHKRMPIAAREEEGDTRDVRRLCSSFGIDATEAGTVLRQNELLRDQPSNASSHCTNGSLRENVLFQKLVETCPEDQASPLRQTLIAGSRGANTVGG